jgi:hypothetical protein
VEHNEGGRRRRGGLLAAAAGLAVLVALTGGAVIALGSSSSGSSTSASSSPSGASSPSGSAAASGAAEAVTATPSAGSTTPGRLSGQVTKDGVHSGDLRYFLLPVPAGADDYDDPDGSVLTADDIAVASADQAGTRGALTTYGFRAGAYRTYLTADGATEVTVKLARFASPDQAAAYYGSLAPEGTALTLGSSHPARGYRLSSGSAESSDAELAVSYQGDVQITVTVTGDQAPADTLLRDLVDAQFQRLATTR